MALEEKEWSKIKDSESGTPVGTEHMDPVCKRMER